LGKTQKQEALKMEENRVYGYARVSTKEQNEDRQLAALLEHGVKGENIFIDKQSGKDFNRPQYQDLMRTVKPGDTLIIKSIDRLGRNYEEIMDQWRVITKEQQVFVAVLDIPLLDTRQKDRDLTGVFIADLVLQILSYVAQTEREFTRQRQAEGIAVAQAKGIRFGRPPMTRPESFTRLREAWRNNEVSARSAARQLGVTPRTFTLWAGEV
jgi:DNA invertase Pin-like site-specific DNA recombinase